MILSELPPQPRQGRFKLSNWRRPEAPFVREEVSRANRFRATGIAGLVQKEPDPLPLEDPEALDVADAVAAPEAQIEAEVASPPEPEEPRIELADLEAARREGYEAGLAEAQGHIEAKSMAGSEALLALADSIRAASLQASALRKPVKLLAMHLAREVVRGELITPGKVIERLVDRCLDEIDRGRGFEVRLHLHPEDLEDYQQALGSDRHGFALLPDAHLSRGSVRLATDATTIDDLLEHRFEDLSEQLLGDPSAWRASTTERPLEGNWEPATRTQHGRYESPEKSAPIDVMADTSAGIASVPTRAPGAFDGEAEGASDQGSAATDAKSGG